MTINLDRKNVEAARIYDAAITILGLSGVFTTEAMEAVVSKLRTESNRSSGNERELMLRMADLISDIVKDGE